ncbi:MAG: flagellar hook-associated protein FlgK [Gallionellales bacterium GWA2_59_43]|nr:MAG: flagellar hook-associated protein FlgK [Gallionellales bacterium GWA2_59_43]
MNAAQVGLATTEHNIANASTPGFTRQEILISSRAGHQTGAGFIGEGVDVTGVKRIYDDFLNTQVHQEQNRASYLNTYHSAIRQIDSLVADPAAGASPAMQGFFDALNGVASNPESLPSRQAFLGNAQFAVNRFQAIDQRLTDIANGLTNQIASSVNVVNSYARQVATLNGNIKRATALGQGQQPNDLLDQRDLLISKLNQEIKTTVLQNSDGTAGVYIGNGQALVIDEQAMQLLTVQSPGDPSKVEVVYNNNGKTSALQQSSLQGGNLGAYLDFRDQTLEPSRNALGRVALGMAASINQQNQLGQDLNGALGGNLFNAVSPRVDRNTNNDPASGVPSVTIANVAGLTTSDYQLKFNGGTGYTLLRLSDNTATSYATLPQTVDGMTINAPAPITAGDSFLIRPTANAARDIALATNDPTKIAVAAPIRGTAALTNSGTAKISSGTVNAPPPTNANLKNNVTVAFVDATHYTVTDNSTLPAPTVLAPSTLYDPNVGATLTFNGWTTQITGTPVAGDVFNITSNTNATGDNRNALLMASFQTQNLMANGTVSFLGAYSQLVGEVGAKTSELSVTSQAQTNMVAQTVAAQQSVSGVNLDEEAANLIRYQKAYQAAAKAMQIAQTMFDAIMNIK